MTDSCSGSGRPHNAHTTAKINKVKDLALISDFTPPSRLHILSKRSPASIFLGNFFTHIHLMLCLSSTVNLIAVTTLHWSPVYIAARKECVRIIQIIFMQLESAFHLLFCLKFSFQFVTFYGRPLSVSGRPCYILPMFYLYIYFLWPPYSPALVNGGSRKFYKWWTLSVIREVTTWIFSWSSLNYRVGQKVTKFGIFLDPARKLSALTPERGRIL